MIKIIRNLLLFFLMVAIGITVFMLMGKQRQPVAHVNTAMEPRIVEVMTVNTAPFTPEVLAYGTVEPALVLQMRAEVSGRISYVHPELKRGGTIKAGERVVAIAPEDFKSTLAQGQADLANSQSQLAQLQQEEQNVRNALAIAQATLQNVQSQSTPVRRNNEYIQQNLNLARQNFNLTRENLAIANEELARTQSLADRRLIPLNQLDSQRQQVLQLEQQVVQQQQAMVQMEQQLTQQDQSESRQDQSVLQQQQQVSELQGQLETFRSRRASAEAQVRRVQQQVQSQQNNLGRTEVLMPFDARISSVEAKQDGFVSMGGLLFEADNTDGIEILAELPLNHLRSLLSALNGQTVNFSAANAADVLHRLNLSATVRLVGTDRHNQPWQGRVTRFSDSIDPVKRTLGIVVAVDHPYENVDIITRPPLLKGMYVEVTLSAPANEAMVIPRRAVHQGRVYIMNAAQNLEIRPITIQFQEGEAVVVESGLATDEKIVINDLSPVIPGMPLKPLNAEAAVPTLLDTAKSREEGV